MQEMLNTMAPTFAVWQPTKTVEKKINKQKEEEELKKKKINLMLEAVLNFFKQLHCV